MNCARIVHLLLFWVPPSRYQPSNLLLLELRLANHSCPGPLLADKRTTTTIASYLEKPYYHWLVVRAPTHLFWIAEDAHSNILNDCRVQPMLRLAPMDGNGLV